jgi:hypothetical protein
MRGTRPQAIVAALPKENHVPAAPRWSVRCWIINDASSGQDEVWRYQSTGAEGPFGFVANVDRGHIGAQIRQGRRMPDQGWADTADVLRPSRRSLGPLANREPDRERVRDGEASHRPHERRAVAGHRASHGVQTGDGRVQDLAAIARSKPVAESRQRYKVQRRNRSCRQNQIRRLIHAVTDFPA